MHERERPKIFTVGRPRTHTLALAVFLGGIEKWGENKGISPFSPSPLILRLSLPSCKRRFFFANKWALAGRERNNGATRSAHHYCLFGASSLPPLGGGALFACLRVRLRLIWGTSCLLAGKRRGRRGKEKEMGLDARSGARR